MKTAIVQSELFWENPEANKQHFSRQIESIRENVDIIILPEMFSTGFSMSPESFAETMHGQTVAWMKYMAVQSGAAIIGSIIISDGGKFYNRLLFVLPSGEIHFYNKRHLFTLAGEDKVYTAGENKLLVEYKGWKICPLVCYDLRFPVFSRNAENYDLLLYVANWPESRISAWDILLKARAVENMCYVIGVNRTGTDETGHHYCGHSQIVDCLGNEILAPQESGGVYISELNKENLLEAREKFGFLNDRDSFSVLN